MKKTKIQNVFNLLAKRKGKGLTQLDLYLMIGAGQIGWNQFTTRLGAAIFELKRSGCDIQASFETNPNTGTRYKRYVLVGGGYGND